MARGEFKWNPPSASKADIPHHYPQGWFVQITLFCIQTKTFNSYQENQLLEEGFRKAEGDEVRGIAEVLEGRGFQPNRTWHSPSGQSPSSVFSAPSQAPKLWWKLIFNRRLKKV